MAEFSSTSTTDEDAFDEIGFDYGSYDSSSDSTGPSTFSSPNTGGLLGGFWNPDFNQKQDSFSNWRDNEVGVESPVPSIQGMRDFREQQQYDANFSRNRQQNVNRYLHNLSPEDFRTPKAPGQFHWEKVSTTPVDFNKQQVTPVRNPIPSFMDGLDIAFHKPLPTALPGINSGPMSARDQASLSRGNIDVYPENFLMIDGKPVSRNNLGSNIGVGGGFDFNFNMPGIGSFSNTIGGQESIGPNNSMGFPNPYTGEVQEPTIEYDETYGIEPLTLSPQQESNAIGMMLSMTPQMRVAMFGSKLVKATADKVRNYFRTPNLNKIANKPINTSGIDTVKLPSKTRTDYSGSKAKAGEYLNKDLGKINRSAPIRGENIFTNSQILSNRNRLNSSSIPVRARKVK